VPGQVDPDDAAGVVDVAVGAHVERDEQGREGRVGEGELRRVLADRLLRAGREPGHGQHGQQLPGPVDDVVGVEPVGVDRVADPRPPARAEQRREVAHPAEGEVLAEGEGELGDDQHEREVEEQLEPGRVPARVRSLGLKARRLHQLGPTTHRHPPVRRSG
jgi:hypothetical protein